MPPKIDKVNWSASNLPSGISLNPQTGIFTGTPREVGTYKIPIKVKTNYGEDQKDVRICVRPEGHELYAIGDNAKKWSGNAEPDEDWFYKLNIPKVCRLKHIYLGFAAETSLGEWYLLGNGYYGFPSNDYDVTQPLKVPYNDIIDISYTALAQDVPRYGVVFLCADGTCFCSSKSMSYATSIPPTDNGSNIFAIRENRVQSGIVKLEDHWYTKSTRDYNVGLTDGNKLWGFHGTWLGAYTSKDECDVGLSGKTIKTLSVPNSIPLHINALTTDGELWVSCPPITDTQRNYPSLIGSRKFNCPKGNIKEFFSPVIYYCENINARPLSRKYIYSVILTTDNKLYALTFPVLLSTIDTLESPNSEYYMFLGEYNVKKMSTNLMLTEEGELYVWGSLDWPKRAWTYYGSGFERVFPNKKFDDIVLAENTLIATIKE